MGWFNSVKNPKIKSSKKKNDGVPVGLWKKCTSCGEILQSTRLEENNHVCPLCQHHYRITAIDRINLIIDEGSFTEYIADFKSNDPLTINLNYSQT